MMNIHPGVAYDMVKIEQQHRNAKLEHRRHAMERASTSRPAPRPTVYAVRRTTFALGAALLALAAIGVALI